MSDLDDRIRSHQIGLGMRAAEAIEREDKDTYDALKERSDLLDEAQATAREALGLLSGWDAWDVVVHPEPVDALHMILRDKTRALLKRTE